MKKSKSILSLLLFLPLFISAQNTQLPDNIIETDCNQNNPSAFFMPQLLYSTGDNVHAYATPICGDIDGDGTVEIVIAHYAGNEDRKHWANQIGIYSGTDLSLLSTINIPQEIYLQYNPIGIVRYPLDDGAMQGAIVIVCCDDRIRSYSKDGVLLNVSDTNIPCDGTPSFADFNNDGHPELYIGNAIYDAATLKLLCKGPTDGNMGLSNRGTQWSQQYQHRTHYAIPYASNILGNENLELICGSTIYNVNITSRINPSLNSVNVNKTIEVPNGYPQDGHVALADFDLDGELEILVNRDNTHDSEKDYCYIYAYKPSSGQILFKMTHLCRSIGYPAVCNIDYDPYPEILFCDYQYTVSQENIFCLNYIPGDGLSTKWTYHHNDPSGMTTMAFFDFNKDEIPELVYRDAYALNIFNCSGKSHITGNDTISCYSIFNYSMRSGTASEHPIIADVNGDGSAEIITNGYLGYSSGNIGYGSLLAFGHPEWPSARPVWNQYAYNVTNVNEDLTIPTQCFNNATAFTDPNGTIRRPFNNFLQQATYLDQYGEPYNPVGIVEIDIIDQGCDSYTYHGMTYTESGDYEQYIENPYGCDSIIRLQLTIKPAPYVSEIEGEQFIYVTDHGRYTYSIEPVEGAYDYVWFIDNNWAIDNAFGSNSCTVNVNTVGAGTLTVKVYSECGFIEKKIHIEHSLQPDIVVFPNPTYGDFKLYLYGMDGETLIEIYDAIGQRIARFTENANVSGTLLNYTLKYHACGMYLITASNRYRSVTKKIVKNTR